MSDSLRMHVSNHEPSGSSFDKLRTSATPIQLLAGIRRNEGKRVQKFVHLPTYDTRHIELEPSSVTSSEPSVATATPTGRPHT